MIKWISIKDSLPSQEEDVLVFNGKDIAMLRFWKCHGKKYWNVPDYIFGPEVELDYEFDFDNTTHWASIKDLKP